MTIAQLIKRRDELITALERTNQEIASRHGEVDPPEAPKTK